LAAITLEDFARYFFPNMTEKTATTTSKILAVVYGIIAFGLVFVAQQLGGVLQVNKRKHFISFCLISCLIGCTVNLWNYWRTFTWSIYVIHSPHYYYVKIN
jgi:Na+/proline symporter